jgi:hypothetical protein
LLPSSVGSFCRARTHAPTQFETGLIRALWVVAYILVSSNFAHAAVPSWASECAALDDDAARLTCYDAHNPPHKSAARTQGSATPAPAAKAPPTLPRAPTAKTAPTSPPTPTAEAAPASPSRAASDDDFGLTERRQQEAAKLSAAESHDLVARVDSVSAKATGELLLKLDNGQSWLQAQRKAGVLIKAGERITIARGSFGGYLLRSDSGATMRVRRLE